ncbi:scavenger receptor cysteine-rich type 1 protein M130-like [Pholidichthys leucotaenia]
MGGVQAEGKHNLTESDDARLVGGDSRCAGTLEVKHLNEWRPVGGYGWSLKPGAVVYSVRLLNGTSLCSGRLEVKSTQSWSSVCEADFDQQDAEVVCRELGCGPPLGLQVGLYRDMEAPMWTREFQCGGHESALLHCRSSGSARNSCSSGKAVGLTCSEPVRLVGGKNHCSGTLEVKHMEEWRPVNYRDWTLKKAAVVCENLDCGSAVALEEREKSSKTSGWRIDHDCVHSGSSLRECLSSWPPRSIVALTCSETIGPLKALLKQDAPWEWILACSAVVSKLKQQLTSPPLLAHFDPEMKMVVTCDASGTALGAVMSQIQGGVERPGAFASRSLLPVEQKYVVGEREVLACVWACERWHIYLYGRRFTLRTDHWALTTLLETSGSGHRLLRLHRRSEHLKAYDFSTKFAPGRENIVADLLSRATVGASVVVEDDVGAAEEELVNALCRALQGVVSPQDLRDSVRLLNGTSLCSGRLEVKSNQSWSSVCEADFDQQDAEVVCRELGCGPPSVLQGGLYGDVEALMWSKEFQCGGHESALRDCRSSGSARNSCSPGKVVGLTCSEPVRLVGGDSRCRGTLELKQGEWRPVEYYEWKLKDVAGFCEHLDCGSAISEGLKKKSSNALPWRLDYRCIHSGSSLRECVTLTWSSDKVQTLTCSDSVRLLNGTSLCSGRLEVKSNQSWSSVCEADFDQQDAEVVCRELGCGPPSVLQGGLYGDVEAPMWSKEFQCGGHESALLDCRSSGSGRNSCSPGKAVGLTCSEPVRLVGGDSRCTGTVEVKHRDKWGPAYGGYWTLKKAAFVCEHLKCGPAVSVEERKLSSTSGRFVWWISHACVQSKSSIRECTSLSLSQSSTVTLTCSGVQVEGKHKPTEPDDDFRLLGGDSRCSGELEMKNRGEWRPADGSGWNLKGIAVYCELLDCGSAVSLGRKKESSYSYVWRIGYDCVQSGASLKECVSSSYSDYILTLNCSDSVRLLNGPSLCSGRLEVKSNQSWSSVCEADFDQRDAEVVCRELGCGSPSVLQGGLHGDVEAPMWNKEFQCEGHESALLDCRSSGSARNNCSPGKAVGLTCSEPVRLVGGDSRCAGTLEMKHLGEWRPVEGRSWKMMDAVVVCEYLDCGSAVSLRWRKESSKRALWRIIHYCVQSISSLRDCVTSSYSNYLLNLTCSDSVRLLNGTSLCSGRLEVKFNQSWSSVCEAGFDQQDAKVVCREVGCGPPSVLQGVLYGDMKAPMWTKKFQCKGDEVALQDCRSSGSARNSCSPGKAVGLTCSEPVRLVGGDSRCAGTLEMKLGEWRPVDGEDWTLKKATVICELLDCGSAVSVGWREESSDRPVWIINRYFALSGSSLRKYVSSWSSTFILTVTCSGGKGGWHWITSQVFCLEDSVQLRARRDEESDGGDEGVMSAARGSSCAQGRDWKEVLVQVQSWHNFIAILAVGKGETQISSSSL